MKVICRVKGIPQRSATHPKNVVAIPPIPMANPKIRPEAIPTFRGMKLCPMAMVTAWEEMRIRPATAKKIRDQLPGVKKKRYKKIEDKNRLARTNLL